ncbi:hypothetical protein KSS87_009508 [Heliosperma pusillum]|nr:hypothetical protein KSS87_009508 [Heliosperma pusillum]
MYNHLGFIDFTAFSTQLARHQNFYKFLYQANNSDDSYPGKPVILARAAEIVLLTGEIIVVDDHSMTTPLTSRLLKETGDGHAIDDGHDDTVSLEDYRPNDPSPSSKASVRPRPIEHGSPLLPYIPTPKPSPPSHSDNDGSDDSEPSPSGHSDDDGSNR